MNATVSPIVSTKSWDDNFAKYEENSWKDFVITTRMANNAPTGAEFLPSKVTQKERELWRFNKEGLATMAFLRMYEDEPVIVLTTPRQLLEVIFIDDLPKATTVRVAGKDVQIPVRPVTEIALAKRDLADDLNRQPIFTVEEGNALQAFDESARVRRAQEEGERRKKQLQSEQEARQKAQAEQAAKIEKILARKEIRCFTKDDGLPRRGRPVVGNEWECLKNGSFCISVSSYNDETGEHGELIESFRVRKDGAKVKKQNTEAVQLQTFVKSGPSEIEAEDVLQMMVKDKLLMVPIYTGVKPSLIPLEIPFGVRDGLVTTVYGRNSAGKLDTLGTYRSKAETVAA